MTDTLTRPYRLRTVDDHRVTVERSGAVDLETWIVHMALLEGWIVIGERTYHVHENGRCSCGESACVHRFAVEAWRGANKETC